MVTKRSFASIPTGDDEADTFDDEAPVNAKLPSGSSGTRIVGMVLAISFLMVLTSLVTLQVEYTVNHDGEVGTRRERRWVPTLLTDIDVYPGYKGNLVPRGRITIRFEDNESEFLVRYELEGLEKNCIDCAIVVHRGESCDEDPSNPYYNTTLYGNTNPWNNSVNNRYQTNEKGQANHAFVMSQVGIGSRGMKGHVAIVYASDGTTKIGCGVLKNTFNINSMQADIQSYAGYKSPVNNKKVAPSGTVYVMAFEDNVLRLRGSLDGLESNCVKCGIHIHAGLSCNIFGNGSRSNNNNSTPDEIVGDHWFASGQDDAWKAQKATYTSDAKGHANFAFYVYNGYDFEDNVDHALVVHGHDNTRIGCGILKPKEVL